MANRSVFEVVFDTLREYSPKSDQDRLREVAGAILQALQSESFEVVDDSRRSGHASRYFHDLRDIVADMWGEGREYTKIVLKVRYGVWARMAVGEDGKLHYQYQDGSVTDDPPSWPNARPVELYGQHYLVKSEANYTKQEHSYLISMTEKEALEMGADEIAS